MGSPIKIAKGATPTKSKTKKQRRRDFDSYRESTVRGRYRVNKLERELNEMISSNVSYKSYSKSAKEMAKEAHEAAESESKSSRGYKKTTLIETSKKRA